MKSSCRTERKLCFAWDLSNFKGSSADCIVIKTKLEERSFRYEKLRRKKGGPRLAKIIETVCYKIFELADVGKVPWVRLFSNSPELLQLLAIHVPVSMAFTEMRSVTAFTTSEMIEMFTDRTMRDPLGEMMGSWLLMWKDMSSQVAGSAKFAGYFSDVLGERLSEKLPTIFLFQYERWVGGEKGTIKLASKFVEDSYGVTVKQMLDRIAPVLYIPVKATEIQVSKVDY